MKIQTYNFNYNQYKNINFGFKFIPKKSQQQSSNSTPVLNLKSTGNIEDEIIQNLNKEHEYLKEFLKRPGKVTYDDYLEIKANHPHVLSCCYGICDSSSKELFITPKTIAKAAFLLKKEYDKKFKDYTILSIGTSPAIIAEVMQNLGCNVIFLPITKLNELHSEAYGFLKLRQPPLTSSFPNLKTLMKYCSEKGITKKPQKDLILLDYSVSGSTLSVMEKILKEREDIPAEKIHQHAINHDLSTIALENESTLSLEDYLWLKQAINSSKVSKICNVPHFYYSREREEETTSEDTISSKNKTAKQIFKEFDNYSTTKARAWSLCATNEAINLLSESLKNQHQQAQQS